MSKLPVSDNDETVSVKADCVAEQSYPDLAALEAAFGEYCDLQEGERTPEIAEFCARFPDCGEALGKLLKMDGFFDLHPKYLKEVLENCAQIDWPEPGEKRDDFTIVRELGRGSFARVYLATEGSTGDRRVVVKFSLDGEAEARTLGRLEHPHVVPILSARREPKTRLTVTCMPYLGSTTLEDVLERFAQLAKDAQERKASDVFVFLRQRAALENLPVPSQAHRGTYADVVVRIALSLAETLAFLHERGVHHGDLKPSNVLLEANGHPRLLDFNLSHSVAEAAPLAAGSLRYAPPEKLRGFLRDTEHPCDAPADTFALGVMVYELLTGTYPTGDLPKELKNRRLAKHLYRKIKSGTPPLAEKSLGLNRSVATILDRCLAFKPSQRPSATELARALRQQFHPLHRVRQRLLHRPRRTLSLVALFLVLAFLAGFAWASRPPYSEREYALALDSYQRGDYSDAETHFENACRAEPGVKRYRRARGCARLQQSKLLPNDFDKLDAFVADLCAGESGPPSADALSAHAYAQVRKQQYDRAIHKYDKLRAQGFRPVMVLNNRAFCLLALKRFDEAQRDLERAATLDPTCQAVHYNRARLALSRRAQNRQYLISQADLDAMQCALRFGSLTAQLYYEAALLHAQAARDQRLRTTVSLDAPILVAVQLQLSYHQAELARRFLRHALQAGQFVSRAGTKSTAIGWLHSPDELDAIQANVPQRRLPARELRLLDPVSLVDG